MARLIREKDWSDTPFGPIAGWSTALRSAVSIILGSRFPMVLYWGETRALIYNDAWSPVPGQKHPWALGRPGYEVWAEIWDIIGPMFDQVMTQGTATWSEDQLLPLNRFGYVEECYFYYSYSPVRGEGGQVEGVFTAVTETTYRVLAERRERLLREISEATSHTRSPDDAGRVAAERMAGLPEEAPFFLVYLRDDDGTLNLVGKAGDIEGDDLAPATIPAGTHPIWPFETVLRSGNPERLEDLADRFAGRLAGTPWPEPVEQALVVPIASSRPEAPFGFLVAGLSPRRRLDADYQTLFERVAGHIGTAATNAEAYAEEKRRAEQLAELDRAKTAFFSNASHEFRTPLTLMLGPVEDMLARADGQAREELALVQRNGQRLLRLVNTLLDFSRIEAGRVRAAFEPVDLAAYTADLASTFRSAMDRAGLSFTIDTGALDQPVWIDRDMWEKIVLNLISNAFKYTLEGGVTVRLRADGDAARLEVIDTGVGVPEAELPRVFDRFHRIEGQQGRTHEGTGIGLALVKDLVQLHGGTVDVESPTGKGATFAVTVPFGRAHVPADAPPAPGQLSTATRADTFVAEALRWLPGGSGEEASPTLDDQGTSEPLRGQTILLADDNADMRGYVERLLTTAGYHVVAVADGEEAAERALDVAPDLVLSDVMMPRLDGFGLIQRLRGAADTADLPIILLSARAGEEAAIEGIEAGADDYLVKPFAARELLAKVEGAIRLARLRGENAAELREANRQLADRESFLTGVLASSTDCIKVLDLDGRMTFMSEGGQRIMEVSDFNAVAGCPWPDFWTGIGNDQAKAALEAARAGETRNFIGHAKTFAGSPRWWDVAVSPIRGADGKPERILSVSRDITASRENEEERNQLARIVENSADFIGMARADGTSFFLNDAARRLVGLEDADVADVSITDYFPPEEARIVAQEILPHVDSVGSWSGERTFRHFRSGELIPVLCTIFPVTDSDGGHIGYGTVTRDIRERKRAEEQQQLLNNELGHRLKNVLTVVQSVASQTLRQADSTTSAARALASRLSALGEATNVLTASSWESADLLQLVSKAMAPHGGLGDRIRASGPKIVLHAQVTLALALALHELATNAAKYGALSTPDGHVELAWSVTDGAKGEDRRFAMSWKEIGGPEVHMPTRRGFGSTMIERSLRAYFRGDAQIAYPATGVEFEMQCPLGEAGTVSE
ncbi:PAS domain-containing protein [Sphingomonas sp. KR1UV-12]|uniref:histidine kinase n=1 Tax=Sphingomonas aurea TaxID=3063994 RepID=A0ABT9EJ29_9SPHN|nr:PAS domain-containing protein [Sphingomonas sp. KR1UV-12]MDP1026857.1 PAS domain-containing protein [Sphingomonas sp. KR1UV-12]